ncbi:MAG: HemK family protein methyltransferase [Bdellovibrionota bacterium]
MTTTSDEKSLRDFADGMEMLGEKHEVRWVLDEMRALGRGFDYLHHVLERRRAGEPLAYIFGHWAFRNHEFKVRKGTLIPRPETEELVDLVLEKMRAKNKSFSEWKIVDAGAGSGCLGISLYLEAKKSLGLLAQLALVEISDSAISVLEENIAALAPDAKLFKGSWLEWPPETIQVLVSNPPYISGIASDKPDLSVAEWEPQNALFPKDLAQFPDASGPYRELVKIANHVVERGGIAAFELGAAQAEWIEGFVKDNYPLWSGHLVKDMSGKSRFWIMQRL